MGKCKSKGRFIPATCAWSLLLGATCLFFYFPCQAYLGRWWAIVPVYEAVLTAFVLVNFSLATFMDPGIIPRALPDEDHDDDLRATLYKNVCINGITVRMKWCSTCQFYRPPRCSHCSVCDTCIETFDHHCPWVNNCIGRRNYRYFFLFLVSLSLHMVSIFGLCLNFVLEHKQDLARVDTIVSISICVLIVFLFVPIVGLTGLHMILVSRGRTTNEQVTGKFRVGFNPFSDKCWLNCCHVLCGPQFPSLVRPKKFVVKKKKKLALLSAAASRLAANTSGGVNGAGGAPSLLTSSEVPGSGSCQTGVNQVKVFLEPGSIQGLNTSAYNRIHDMMVATSTNTSKLNVDMDGLVASQSVDCEASPPSVIRADGISYALREGGMMTPTSPTKIPAIRATPVSASSTASAKGSPNAPRHNNRAPGAAMNRSGSVRGVPERSGMPHQQLLRPDHISIQQQQQQNRLQQQARKTASDGQLMSSEHLPELAGSPQRGMYTWRDPSPATGYHHHQAASPHQPRLFAGGTINNCGSHPTSPTTGNSDHYAAQRAYQYPPQPQGYWAGSSSTVSGSGSPQVVRHPVGFRVQQQHQYQLHHDGVAASLSPLHALSRLGPVSGPQQPSQSQQQQFSRAMHVSDSLDLSAARVQQHHGNAAAAAALDADSLQAHQSSSAAEGSGKHRRSVYDMKYEISV